MLKAGLGAFFNKPWKRELLLLSVTAILYFAYFHHLILNINSLMSSITNDTLKNYYTYAYQIKHGTSPLHFQGMNYPFGEHVVYTDCQPLLCWILRPFKFTHDHLIGILHGLIFLSFILTPLILRRIFLRLSVPEIVALPCALGIALLSPQFLKMNAGHFALAYTVIIPLSMLLLLRFIQNKKTGTFTLLTIYNTLVFFLHPYMGFGLALFSFFTLFAISFFSDRKRFTLLCSFICSAIPVVFFKLCMLLTDSHPGRTDEPFGLDVMVENSGSLLSPEFGPFKSIMESITPERTNHFEGHTYLGFGNIVLILLFPVVLIFRKKTNSQSGVVFAFLVAGLVLLFFALGWHRQVLNTLGIKAAALNQFRAVCRFAWFFYYALSVFLVVSISRRINSLPTVLTGVAVYLLLCGLEAHFFFRYDKEAFWNWRNLFNKDQLSHEENKVLASPELLHAQALLPLPLFHGGSELYDRLGAKRSMIPAMLYSYHSGHPIVSMLASRTSIPESAEVIGLLNTNKKNRVVFGRITDAPLLVLRTADACLPDEDRVWTKSQVFQNSDSVTYATINPRRLGFPIVDSAIRVLPAADDFISDTASGILFLKKGPAKPFVEARTKDMEPFLTIRKNQFPTATYILSLHFHYRDLNWRSLACNVVLARDHEGKGEWLQDIGIRNLSGFYDGFGVFETYIDLEKDKGYDLLIYGSSDYPYHISDVMIRPAGLTILSSDSLTINNYPR